MKPNASRRIGLALAAAAFTLCACAPDDDPAKLWSGQTAAETPAAATAGGRRVESFASAASATLH